MKLKGTQTQTRTETVEITTSVRDVLDGLKKEFRKKQGLDPEA